MYTVRAADPPDAEQVAGLLDRLFPDDPNRLTEAEIGSLGNMRNLRVFVAADGSTVAGFLVLRNRVLRPWTSVDFVGVDPGHESKGLGSMLTLHALNAANRPLVRLFVRASNARAYQLYLRCGFHRFGLRRANYADGEDAIIMMALSARFRLTKPKIVGRNL